MAEEVKQYLWTEFKFNNLPKYYKYFDTWIENLTENQILYYIKWPLSPMEVAIDSKPIQCEFESHRGYKKLKNILLIFIFGTVFDNRYLKY